MEWLLQYPLWLQWSLTLITGCIYGGLVGLIPSAGPSKALILLFAIVSYFDFPGGDYLFVLFSIATVVSCSIGDSFSSVLLGIPGANGAAATMVDGFPLAKQGKASYALSASIFCSTINGLLFGLVGLIALPFYEAISKYMGVPEIFGMVILSLSLISVLTTKYTFRSLMSIAIGLYVGSIGYGIYQEPRNTFGLEYLEDGIPIVILVVGLFAIPELYEALKMKYTVAYIDKKTHNRQTIDGIKAVIEHKWLALQGGVIGWITGLLPGTGGGIGDWTAYAATTAVCKDEKVPFGEGNIKGVIGSEGANNSGKMGALLPTIMFGIPGNKAFAIAMSLWLYVGFEVGTSEIMEDEKFIDHLFGGYMLGTLIAGFIMLLFARHLSKIVYYPIKYWLPPMFLLTIWAVLSSRHYVSVQEDLVLLTILGMLGLLLKRYKFSRPAFLMSFILFDKVESSLYQMYGIYFYDGNYLNNSIWGDHSIMTSCLLLSIFLVIYGIFNKNKLEYS